MHKDGPKLARERAALMAAARQGSPETWGAFATLGKAATSPGARDSKTKATHNKERFEFDVSG